MSIVIATHRVVDSANTTVGFIIDGRFFTVYTVIQNISSIDNLSVTKSGIIRAKKALIPLRYKDLMKINYEKSVYKRHTGRFKSMEE